ncbi:MAG: hypothetical protein OHK0013_21460 [Sandaracinaceae bacterium]
MRDLIPAEVFSAIQEQYRSARPITGDDFKESREDEDTLSGAFGKGLREAVRGARDGYVWSTHVTKTRGRGKGALEKRTGADVVIEIEVRDATGGVVGQKGLLGQAKTEWGPRDRRLVNQAERMEEVAPNASVVIDYRPDGTTACRSSSAISAEGRRKDAKMKPLGDLLADEFLTCEVGRRGMSYDDVRRQMLVAAPEGILRIPYVAELHVLTTVEPLGKKAVARLRRRLLDAEVVRATRPRR